MASRRPPLAVGCLLGLLLTLGPASVRAGGGTEVIPDEPGARVFPELASAAFTGDVSGDGVRELLRVVPRLDASGLDALEALSVDRAGELTSLGQVPLRRSASAEEIIAGRGINGIDGEDMIGVHLDDAVAFLAWQERGVEEVLVLTMGYPAGALPCCLTVWKAGIEQDRLALRLVAETGRQAATVAAADLDADGTDELVVAEGGVNVRLLRWTGSQFGLTALDLGRPGPLIPVLRSGETDGLPGAEVIVSEGAHDQFAGNLTRLAQPGRISLRGGVPRLERSRIGQVGDLAPAQQGGEPGIWVAAEFGPVLVPWPPDGVLGEEFIDLDNAPYAAVAGVAGTLTVSESARATTLTLWSGDLEPAPTLYLGVGNGEAAEVGSLDSSGRANAVRDVAGLAPYAGLWPGGVPGHPDALVYAGQLVPLDLVASDTRIQGIAVLPGLAPVGAFGPAGAWTALADVAGDLPLRGFQPDRRDAAMQRLGTPGQLSMAPTQQVLSAEPEGGIWRPQVSGAVKDTHRSQTFLNTGGRVSVDVGGPAGSRLLTRVIGPNPSTWVGQAVEPTSSVLLPLSDLRPSGNQQRVVRLAVVTPAGHAYHAQFVLLVLHDAPHLSVDQPAELFAFSPQLTGGTDALATVTVNGQPVVVADTGRFALDVSPGLLPTEYRVVASDPVGNRREAVVSLVWPLDYRKLPSVPIVVILTGLAAAGLFLRAPRQRPAGLELPEGSSLEDMEH